MSKFISGLFLVAFATAGIVSLLREFWIWLLKADCPGTYYIVIPMSGHKENAEAMLRRAAGCAKSFGRNGVRIVCADCGMDEETKQICKHICEEKDEIRYCRIQELDAEIKQ